MSDRREVSIHSGELTLEGVLHTPDGDGPFPAMLVCHPHPQYGGDMHNNVVGALVRAALDNGVAALRFNFRGAGESEGSFAGGSGEQEDVKAAFAFLKAQPEVDADRVTLAGYSFGAAMALLTASDTGPNTLIVVSMPTMMFDLQPPSGDFPMLMVSGDRDDYSDPATLQQVADSMGERASLEILEGVDHFWWGSDGRLIEIVSGFLGERAQRVRGMS
jgi:alpha/beta superfamily hydrolase